MPSLDELALMAALDDVRDMSGERARFILDALLVGGYISPDTFRAAYLMADYSVPIEQENAPKDGEDKRRE